MSAAARLVGLTGDPAADRWDVCGRCTHYRVEHIDRRGPGRRCDHLDPHDDQHDPCPCAGFRPRTNASPRTSVSGHPS